MRKKLETLPLAVLKDIAKDKQVKHYSTMKKAELIDILAELSEADNSDDDKKESSDKESAEIRNTETGKTQSKSEAQQEIRPVKVQQPVKNDDPYRQDYDPEMVDKNGDAHGILEVMQDGYGFIRCENFLPGDNDVYVAPVQIKRFGLKTGDIIHGCKRVKNQGEKFSALLYIKTVNGFSVAEIARRRPFEKLTPIFPNERIHLELPESSVAMRIVDLISPIGKGQRGMIVAQPKAGKTTLLKQIANSILKNHKDMHLMILLIDERPEEVTDIRESLEGDNVEVIYSTFDELPERHKRVSEMTIERAKRLVEQKQDVVILLDSITRLARAYNLVIPPSGRTLSGGLDPAALHKPKKFFGAARNIENGGSLTILATALVETGSRMDEVIFEEFKGTGNMELQLDRNLSNKRIFPAVNIVASSTRRDDLLQDKQTLDRMWILRKYLADMNPIEAMDFVKDRLEKTKDNDEFLMSMNG